MDLLLIGQVLTKTLISPQDSQNTKLTHNGQFL